MSADDDQHPGVPPPEAVNATAKWLLKVSTMTPRPTDLGFRDMWNEFMQRVAITTRRLRGESELQNHKKRKEHSAAEVKRGTETQTHDREPPLPPDCPPGTHWMLVRPAARKNPPAPLPLPSSAPPNKRKRGRPRKNDVPPQKPVAKMRVSSSPSSSGLLDLADASEELEEENSREKKGEKFIIDYEIDHLVWVRMSKKNRWIPGQITAISHSLGGRRTTYDVEFFEKDCHGQYTRAENLAISRLEPVTKDSMDRHSKRNKSKRWKDAIEELRDAYNASCAEDQRI